MKFHPGRLGIMTPKGETLADIDIQENIKKEEKNRSESVKYAKEYGTLNSNYSCPTVVTFARPM